ncbi:MAG: BlaI/MecI/CopY family transcriptional regulator [Muribaculaceae bacterium]|nr:BlaI/MecI/CopY family transcriptional regulator [Muribaculaceae bacterium]
MTNLTPQEETVMRAAWQADGSTVKEMMERMPSPVPPYTTVASVVRNLERKGFLSARKVGNTYLYTPAVQSADFKRKCLGDIVSGYFRNSYKELVTFFARDRRISPEELEDIIELIKKGETE